MNAQHPPPRSETRAAIDNLDRLLRWGGGEGAPSQDWDLVLADSSRLTEFCDLYDKGALDDDTKFALMMLIVASLDDAQHDAETTGGGEGIAVRIERLLRQEFVLHLHTIHSWALLHQPGVDTLFDVTPMMRRIWADCFRVEYQPWLDS